MLALQAFSALALTLALLVGCAWAFKTFGHRLGLNTTTPTTKRLKIIEKTTLNPQTTLHLVQLDDTEHLLATTAAQTTVISSHPVKKSAKVKA